MASLSLPRVLQLKKNSLDAEREQFEKFQTLAIQKAINAVETPVKEKHVRSTIIGTFQEQSAITYWMVAIRLPLQDNRIVSWKFCHVTHKLLREGHPACLDDSQRHIGMIENLGKLWVHLREGYGKLVHLYCNLLVCKLKFHARNPRFPGNMQLTADELDAIAENDVNNYFQLCVELFDYMDEILNLQAAVFDSLGNARANSMTASGQCRLAALIPCAQDSSQIYDCNVRLLFRLHASLPADTLAGHRERFRQQFKKLSSFYKHASSLQYYRNLLTLPVLPSNPPNFLIQSDFGTYVTPVVSIPEQPPDEVDSVGSLIDTSDTISQATTPEQSETFETRTTPSPQPDPVVERDRLIDHLQNELRRMRTEVSQMVQERNTMLGNMREHCARLESQLQAAKTEMEEEKHKAEILSLQTPEIKQKLAETEEKAKVTDEKFQKLKGAYTQLREEHITLIRQKAEVDKLSASLRAAAAQHESAKTTLQQQLNDRIKDMEFLQQSASSSEEVDAYKNEISSLRTELEQSRQKELELETLRASMEALEIEHKTAKTEQEEKITILANELKETKENLDNIRHERDERESEISKIKEELIGLREKTGDDYKKAVEEKDAALKQVTELTHQFQVEKEEQVLCINKFQSEIEHLQQKFIDAETNYTNQFESMKHELNSKNKELENVVNLKDIEIEKGFSELAIMKNEFETMKSAYESKMQEETLEVTNLLAKINQLNQLKLDNDNYTQDLNAERENIQADLRVANEKIELLNKDLTKKMEIIQLLEQKLSKTENEYKSAVEELKTTKTKEIPDLKDKLRLKDEEKIEIERILNRKNKEIEDLLIKSENSTTSLETQKSEYDEKLKEKNIEVTVLTDKLKTVTECKDEIIANLKSIVAEKDSQVISLNVEVTKLSESVLRLEEELKETHAELEIGKNEFVTLKEEHDNIIQRNESNLVLKNQELRDLNNTISEMNREKETLMLEKEKIIHNFTLQQQVLENDVTVKGDAFEKLNADYNIILNEKDNLHASLSDSKSYCEALKKEKEIEIQNLIAKMEERESSLKLQIDEKDDTISKAQIELDNLKHQLTDLEDLISKEKEELELVISKKDSERQMLEGRLQQTESKRLNAECELQDLLQHNTVLEADVAELKKQLEETKKELENQSSNIVKCAGEAALQVTSDALSAAEHGGAHEANRAAAELAAKALEEMARHTEVKGNEELVAKSAIYAAHNTVQLSSYVMELSNLSTDIELSDKLNNECRTMLTATKQCLEALTTGSVAGPSCVEARGRVLMLAQSAATADRLNTGALSVDDELAGMDKAIEDAAKQIEEMLAASRAGDSGVKLEVNGKILDACTTLMGAVKVLVRDARALQTEIGDPKTRQRMYRKNPQWSEGLISAAKAVVFAAKLLVESADEAVGAAGRVEGVSAAAHEVAGSTAQLVAASRARAPPAAPALARLTAASRHVAAATGALVAAVRAASALRHDSEALDTSALTLTATRRLEMESKVRSLELESALDAERARLAALRKRHYHLAQLQENEEGITNGKE